MVTTSQDPAFDETERQRHTAVDAEIQKHLDSPFGTKCDQVLSEQREATWLLADLFAGGYWMPVVGEGGGLHPSLLGGAFRKPYT